MTYAQYGLIQASDYNGFANNGSPNLNNIWATGSGSSGYGQTALTTVSSGSIISHTEWDNLVNDIAAAAAHQGTTITSITPPAQYGTVAYLSALSTNLSAINTGKLNAATIGTAITGSGQRTTNWGANVSIPTVTSTITVTFASANQARYFFNAGGTISVQASKTAGAGTPEDTAWVSLCTEIGTLSLPAVSTSQTIATASYTGLTQFGQTGSAPTIYTRHGFYDLTSTPAILFRQFADASTYTSDYIQMSYSTTGTVVTISVAFTDSNTTAPITGNLTVTASVNQPETTNITNSWGTPTVSVTAPA